MSDQPAVAVSAGPLSGWLAGAELREVDVQGWRALDAVYVAVRDAAWQTVPGTPTDVRSTTEGERTTTEFSVRHRAGAVDFAWRGTLETRPGHLRFTMDGAAHSDFEANRVGFALLHPQRLKGRAVQVTGPAGTVEGAFPVAVSPHQPFTDVQSLQCDVADGVVLDVLLEGDLFEVEDHRNWSDPGWKTYCTPLAAPAPVLLRAGERIHQSVELRARIAPAAAPGPQRLPGDVVVVRVGRAPAGRVPSLGLGASGLRDPGRAALRTTRALRPSHLHVELEARGAWRTALDRAQEEAGALGVPLDVALVAPPEELAEMAGALAGRMHRVAVFSPDRHTTDPGTVGAVRTVLAAAGTPPLVGGGSRAHLAELNRGSFDPTDWDFCAYGVTPQVHHSDDVLLLSTTSALADGLERARAVGRGAPVVVGPVTLRPRFNATTAVPELLPDPEQEGPDADPRLATDLASTYLAAAVGRLVGADAVTAFRTTGPRGVLGSDGSPRPVARAVALLAGLGGRAVLPSGADDPSLVPLATVAPGPRGSVDVVVANLAEDPCAVRVVGAAVWAARVLGGAPLDADRVVVPGRSVVVLGARAAEPVGTA